MHKMELIGQRQNAWHGSVFLAFWNALLEMQVQESTDEGNPSFMGLLDGENDTKIPFSLSGGICTKLTSGFPNVVEMRNI